MNERPSQPPAAPRTEAPATPEREMTIEEAVALIHELVANPEGFPFGGLKEEVIASQKEDEAEPWYPEEVTKLDDLLPRCEEHGIKVVFGDDPKSGNAIILPKDSDNSEADGILPRTLNVTPDMDPKLRKLVEFHQMRKNKK